MNAACFDRRWFAGEIRLVFPAGLAADVLMSRGDRSRPAIRPAHPPFDPAPHAPVVGGYDPWRAWFCITPGTGFNQTLLPVK